ncbi:MAG: HU family DNA-binding protein [Pirellulales bacterium]|nr:HU family DNA-binding protein [Pirellulales bacterium]
MAKGESASKKAPSKSELLNSIAEQTELSRKQVGAVLDALAKEIEKAMSDQGPGVFAIPGLIKITKKTVPARPAQMNVPNPFKPGETRDIPARPASSKITVRALKTLKDMV